MFGKRAHPSSESSNKSSDDFASKLTDLCGLTSVFRSAIGVVWSVAKRKSMRREDPTNNNTISEISNPLPVHKFLEFDTNVLSETKKKTKIEKILEGSKRRCRKIVGEEEYKIHKESVKEFGKNVILYGVLLDKIHEDQQINEFCAEKSRLRGLFSEYISKDYTAKRLKKRIKLKKIKDFRKLHMGSQTYTTGVFSRVSLKTSNTDSDVEMKSDKAGSSDTTGYDQNNNKRMANVLSSDAGSKSDSKCPSPLKERIEVCSNGSQQSAEQKTVQRKHVENVSRLRNKVSPAILTKLDHPVYSTPEKQKVVDGNLNKVMTSIVKQQTSAPTKQDPKMSYSSKSLAQILTDKTHFYPLASIANPSADKPPTYPPNRTHEKFRVKTYEKKVFAVSTTYQSESSLPMIDYKLNGRLLDKRYHVSKSAMILSCQQQEIEKVDYINDSGFCASPVFHQNS